MSELRTPEINNMTIWKQNRSRLKAMVLIAIGKALRDLEKHRGHIKCDETSCVL